MAARLRELVPEARVAVAHGQMDEGTLEQVVLDFWEKRFDVLVCTTIIESGIDMPTVNTLVVDRADRLGLGQLHQLRGRVGRSGQRAYAYLFHPADKVLSEAAYERLRTIGEQTELGAGFKIAMRDLEIRGAGNLLGQDQSGHIAAVGYDLYVQLVAEAVAEMKGEPLRPAVEVKIDVPSDAHLPVGLRRARGPPPRGLPAPGLGRPPSPRSTTSGPSGSTASARCPPPPRGSWPWPGSGSSACAPACVRCRPPPARPGQGAGRPGRRGLVARIAPLAAAGHRRGCACGGCVPSPWSRRSPQLVVVPLRPDEAPGRGARPTLLGELVPPRRGSWAGPNRPGRGRAGRVPVP